MYVDTLFSLFLFSASSITCSFSWPGCTVVMICVLNVSKYCINNSMVVPLIGPTSTYTTPASSHKNCFLLQSATQTFHYWQPQRCVVFLFFFSGCTDYFNMHFTHHFCPSTYPCEISIWNLFCCQIMITGEAFNTDPFCAVTVSNQFLLQGLNPFFFLNVVGVPGTDCTVSLPAHETSFT